ncbi:MAG: O-antigen ligase family protein, partial [Microcella sp.]|uniref:hypothetical protein n=1 Tax=Microcella sp. TaxID=1913979 RepID=UPI00331460E4
MTVPAFFNAALFGVVAVALLLLSATSTKKFLFGCGFVMPLFTPSLTVGVNLYWFNIIGLVALVTLPVAPTKARSWNISRPFLYFVGYVMVVTVIWMAAEYGSLERYRLARYIGLGPAQTLYKMPVQLAGFMMQCAAFFIIPARATQRQDIYAAFRGYLGGIAVSVAAGIVLLLVTGSGVIDERGALTFSAGGAMLTRIGGLSGEPKTLGAFIVVGLGLLVAYGVVHPSKEDTIVRRPTPWILAFACALFFTFSTSAWLAFAVVLVVLMFTRERVRRRASLLLVLVAAIAIVPQVPVLRSVVEERITKRVFADDTQELEGSKDNYVLDVYRAKPHFVFIGFGMGGTDLEATPFLLRERKYELQLQYVRTPTPSTTGARLAGDLGLVGMLLLVYCGFSWSARLRRGRLTPLAVFVLSTGAGIMFQSFNSVAAFLFLCGGGLALVRL